MKKIKASDGTLVTEEMVDKWCEALDEDRWPEGWHNVGEIVYGRPPSATESSAVLSLKIPIGMKRAIERAAKTAGISTSAFARNALADKLIATDLS